MYSFCSAEASICRANNKYAYELLQIRMVRILSIYPDTMTQGTDIHQMPGHLIRRLHQVQASLFVANTAPLDVPPVQFAALAMIDAHPDIDQASLAGAIAYDPVTTGGVIARIEAKGWIIRRVDPLDKRSRLLRIEPSGKDILGKMFDGVAKTQADLMKPLAASERKVLIELIQKLLSAHNDSARVPLKPVSPRKITATSRTSPVKD
jgi:MarR family transcriptional regulator, temperature-dependent positive regulator of motility